MSARQFCEEREYSATTLYWWSSHLKRTAGASGPKKTIRLARVVRKRSARPEARTSPIDPATCPVRALQDWLELSGIGDGPAFRPFNRHEQLGDQCLTDFAVAFIIKRVADKAGLATPQLSGHSLRAGFVTEAKKNGADDAAIMDQAGHKSLAMMHRYHRRTKKWTKPANAKLGL